MVDSARPLSIFKAEELPDITDINNMGRSVVRGMEWSAWSSLYTIYCIIMGILAFFLLRKIYHLSSIAFIYLAKSKN